MRERTAANETTPATGYLPRQPMKQRQLFASKRYLLSSSTAETFDIASPSRESIFSTLVRRCLSLSCVQLKSDRRRANRVDRLSRVDSMRSIFWLMFSCFSFSLLSASWGAKKEKKNKLLTFFLRKHCFRELHLIYIKLIKIY